MEGEEGPGLAEDRSVAKCSAFAAVHLEPKDLAVEKRTSISDCICREWRTGTAAEDCVGVWKRRHEFSGHPQIFYMRTKGLMRWNELMKIRNKTGPSTEPCARLQNVAGFDEISSGKGAVSTQKFGAVFKNLGQSDILGQISPPRAAAQRERGSASGAGRRDGDRKGGEKKNEEKDYLVGVRRNKHIAPHLCPKRGCPK